jgi:hypothetical protein
MKLNSGSAVHSHSCEPAIAKVGGNLAFTENVNRERGGHDPYIDARGTIDRDLPFLDPERQRAMRQAIRAEYP